MNKNNIKRLALKNILLILVVLIWIVSALLTDKFMTSSNIFNIIRNASMKGVIAVGMTTVIICGEIDLSISSTVAMTTIVTGLCFSLFGDGVGALFIALLIMIGISLAMASIHAFFVIKYRVPAMIATMATMKLLFGIAGLTCKGYPVTTFPSWYSNLGGGQILGGFPTAGIFFVVSIVVFGVILKYTKYGRNVYATGGNLEAARLSGINTTFTRWMAYFIVQLMAVCAGIILSSQVRAGNHSYAQDWGLDIICSVIVGGTSFNGGIGTVFGTVVGMILVSSINNILTLMNVSTFYQYMAQGALILLAIVVNQLKDGMVAKIEN